MVLGPIIYFLFVRGTPNGWKKDKSPWTFASYMSLVACSRDLASGVTGQVQYVDCGFSIIGMHVDDEPAAAPTT